MSKKKSAHYQRLYRQRLRDLGLVKKEIWILPERAPELHYVEKELRKSFQRPPKDEFLKSENWAGGALGVLAPAEERFGFLMREAIGGEDYMKPKLWTSSELYESLSASGLFAAEGADIELINAADPCILIIMRDYGDLPLFMTVSRQHILVEALLWPLKAVSDPDGFNCEVLRTHKFFSLSTIGLDIQPGGEENYIMFGSLSAASSLQAILFEIETLAENVIRATEAYAGFLVVPNE